MSRNDEQNRDWNIPLKKRRKKKPAAKPKSSTPPCDGQMFRGSRSRRVSKVEDLTEEAPVQQPRLGRGVTC